MADTIGRWIAATFDFRFTGIVALVVVAVFALLKVIRRDSAAISIKNCLGLAFSVFTFITATNAGAVFLLTSPPALDLLSRESLALVGVVTVIAVYLQIGSYIIAQFGSVPEAPVEKQADIASTAGK